MSKILCVGTLIIDIINDKIDKLPNEGECVTTGVSINLGGNAYSSSVNIRRLTSQESSVYCYGLTGTDDLGSLFENGLNKEGVICTLSKVSGKKTSCNIILQEKGKDRRYIFSEGANSQASKEDLLKIIDEIEPDVIVFGEMPSIGIVGTDFIEIVNHSKSRFNSLIFLDLLVNASEDYSWLSENWTRLDVIHCNYGEGRHVTKKDTLAEVCQWFLDNGVTLPIVSDGENGCYYGYKNRVTNMPAYKTDEVDATGAGDALMAGIVKGLLKLQNVDHTNINNIEPDVLEEIITYGSVCGAIAVRAHGCISDISSNMVDDFISKKLTSMKETCAR